MRKFAITLVVLLVFCATVYAQQDRATLTGTITDQSGSVVPNVRVVVQNTETNAVYESKTNESGQYTVPNLPIGQYRLTFDVSGFKKLVRDGITLNIAQVARVDGQLELGTATESVRVTAEAPLLQTDTPDVGTLLEQRRVIDLPLSFNGGRYPENFAYKLTPGVEGDNWTSRINGSPSFSKEVLLDGASATIYIGGHFGESSVSMEALEEFKIQTSGMNAEFGKTAGGIFNFVMRSGANQIHGSGMGNLRNEWMNSNTFANNARGAPKQRDRRQDIGGSFGGPVYIPKVYNGKDKTFFWLAYERYKDANRGFGSPNKTVPLLEWYDGDMSRYLTTQVLGKDPLGRDVLRGQIYNPMTTRTEGGKIVRDPFANNQIPSALISKVSKNVASIMKQHYAPAVKGPDGKDAMISNSYFPVFNTASFEQIQFSAKLDHSFNPYHKVSGSFAYIDRPRVLIDSGGYWDPSDPDGGPFSRARLQQVRTKMGRFAYDWTLRPNLLNHFGVAANRQANPSVSKHVDEAGGQILGIQGIKQDMNFPQIGWTGGDRVNLDTIGYLANGMIAGTTYEALDTVSWSKGRHSIKFGFDWKASYLNERDAGGPGTFNFAAGLTGMTGFNQTGHPFATFLMGQVTSASVPVNTPTGSKLSAFGGFIQDDFKVSRKLTLNLGVRWDGQPQQTEKYNRLHHFAIDKIDTLTGLPGTLVFGDEARKYIKNQWNDFAPRVGLAYQITPKLVFRGAYGIFYVNRAPNDWSGVPYGYKWGYTMTNNVTDPGGGKAAFNWDNGYPGKVVVATKDPTLYLTQWAPVYWDPDGGKVGYTQQWNGNLQYELPGNMVVDLGYVGSHSVGLYANQLRQLNQIPTAALALGDTLGTWIDRDSDIPAAAKALGARYPFKTPGTWMPVQQTLQPFPQVPYWSTLLSYNVPLGFSSYDALQIALNKRYSRGLTWLANYTWSKTMDNVDSGFQTWVNGNRPLDYYNLKLEKTISPYDITHVVKAGVTYELPFGKGKRFLNTTNPIANVALAGWTLQYIGNYRSGLPLWLGGTGTPNANFATNRPVVNNPNGESLTVDFNPASFNALQVSGSGNPAHKYINTALFKDPPRYVRGNASLGFPGLRGFPNYQDDFGLQKNFSVKEKYRFQLRLEMLNAFNRHRFSSINTTPSSPLFGQVTGLDGGFYRQVQVGARVDF